MKKHLISAAIAASLLLVGNVAKAGGMSCLSRMVVNAQDTQRDLVRAQPKVYALIKNDLKNVFKNINKSDRDSQIRTLLDKVSIATGTVLNRTASNDIADAVILIYNSTVKTIAFIEKNANDPDSSNITNSKKGQVNMAVTQVISAYVSCK